MADVGTTAVDASSRMSEDPRTARQIRRARRLPGGRAVVGALLVTAAAVTTFAAYLNVTAEPTTSYLVALETLSPGTRFEQVEDVSAAFGSATVDLTSPLDERAIPVSEIESLVGRVLVAPLERGDLVLRTVLVDDRGVAPARTMSFAISRTAAVGGVLRPGERVDVLATFGSGDASYTAYVVRGVPLLRITGLDGGSVEGSSELILTVAVTDPVAVQALGHAVNTADVFVVRAGAYGADDSGTPGAFRPSADDPGPAPDPAGAANGLDAFPAGDADDPGDDATSDDDPDGDDPGDGEPGDGDPEDGDPSEGGGS